MDYTSICQDVMQTPEFKTFQKITGGVLISTAAQLKNGTIQLGNLADHTAWGFFSNGYVRESFYGISHGYTMQPNKTNTPQVDTHANIVKKPGPEDKEVNVDLYLRGIAKMMERFNKRDDQAKKRVEKLSSPKLHKTAITMIFDPDNMERLERSWVNGRGEQHNWRSLPIHIISTLANGDFEYIVDNYFSKANFMREYRIRK